MCRDEADIAEISLRHIATQVDFIIVADNNSTDGTRDILNSLVGELPLEVRDDPEVAFYQSRKMSALADDARLLGATWIVPIDFDEIWAASGGGTVAECLNKTRARVVWADTYEHPPITDPLSPYRALVPKKLRKVAFRASPGVWLAQGNHDVSLPGKRAGGLEIREFQYRSLEQFTRKVRNGKRAYDATDLPEGEGAHWRTLGALPDDEIAVEWKAMQSRTDVIYDPAPIRC